MLKLFEKNTGIQVIVILMVTVLLWLRQLRDPQPLPTADGFAPLYNLLHGLGLVPLAGVIIAMLLVFLGGLGLNLMLTNAGLVSQKSLLPALYYILFMSAGAETLSPTLIAGLLCIAFTRLLLLHSTLLTIPINKIFGATAIIGISTMFYLPSLALLVSYLLVAINYRLYSWRDWLVMLLGLLAPYMLLWMILFMNGGLEESFMAMSDGLVPQMDFQLPAFSLSLAANALLCLFFVISLVLLLSRHGSKTALIQKNTSAVLMPTVAALAMMLYMPVLPVNLQLFAMPFALCASLRFPAETSTSRYYRSRNRWKSHVRDFLFLTIIAAAVVC